MDALMIQPGKDYVTLAEAATVSFWQGLPAQYRHMLIGAEVLAIILLVRVILHLIQNMGKRGKRPHDG